MRVPLSWLYEFVRPGLSAEDLAETLTMGGLVVEHIHRPTAGTRGVRVAEVKAVQRIEGSDKLSLVEAFDGDETLQVVCGASNFAVGDRVPWAKPGSVLPGGFEIGRKKLMGVESNGMLASARELGVGDDHRGIWVLEPDAPLGADVSEWLQLDDAVLELDLNPDRGYALSILGVARDVAALTGAEVAVVEAGPAPQGDPGVPVTIDAADRCRRFDGRRIKGVTVRPSPAWLQRRLNAAGIRPISNIVDATNYVMIEIGNPIHAYDVALLDGPRIDVRVARDGERLTTLDGVDRELDPDDLVIADAGGAIGLAGVMGGEATEINDATTDVFLEVANFTSRTVLRTARRHRLYTEGSRRWERHVPAASAPLAASRCADLIVRLAGGQVTGHVDVYPEPQPATVISLRTDRARAHLGLDISAQRQAQHLRAIGCVISGSGEVLDVTAPAYRPDLRIEEDLHEEIARIEGYETIPERLPSTGQIGGRVAQHDALLRVRRALAGAGWTEVAPFPFMAFDDARLLGLPADDPRAAAVALANPLSQEESVLHTTPLPGLLRIVRRNANRQLTDLALFTASRVFLHPDADHVAADGGPSGAQLPAEPLVLGFAATGAFDPPRFDRPARPADVYDLLGAVDLIRSSLGLPAVSVAATDEMPFHPGRAARLELHGRLLGVVGELHPRVTEAFDVPPRTLAGEIDLGVLTDAGARFPNPFAPSTLPPLLFDVAVVVDADVPAADVEAAVRDGAGARLTTISLFDVFSGSQVGEGRKSLAFRLRLDDPEQTLSDVDERAAIDGIEASVATRVGGRLRR